jgi:MFS family permease
MASPVPQRAALYLAVVQFFFALTWTVYVIYLPALAAQVGIPKTWIVFILLLDQAIFVVMDFAMGVLADRVARVLGRLGRVVVAVTLASCAAFLLLPWVAPQGAPWLFLALTIIWTATSSALRAPPLVLLGKYAARSAVPWLTALTLFGLGVASAIGPYVTVMLRNVDPRLPFALASIALAAATLGIVWVERALARVEHRPHDAASAEVQPPPARTAPPIAWFLLAVLLVGAAAQIHIALNSTPLYQRFASNAHLQYLTPLFWVGFSVLLMPAGWATKRYGGLVVMGAGGAVAALAAWAAWQAGSLGQLIAAQVVAGGAWGCVLMSAVAAALAIGHTGREGKVTGALFSLLALAACARIAIIAVELNKDPQFAQLLTWLPAAGWAAGGVLLLLLLLRTPARRLAGA